MKEGEAVRFGCRAAGIVFDRGRVLLEKVETLDFWTLPGGQVELGETSEDALRREMREEAETEVDIDRLTWVAEAFYRFEDTACHEICFFYLMDLPPGSALAEKDEFLGAEGPAPLTFRWLPVDDLDDISLKPSFLRRGLRNLPEGIEHLILAEGNESPLRPPEEHGWRAQPRTS